MKALSYPLIAALLWGAVSCASAQTPPPLIDVDPLTLNVLTMKYIIDATPQSRIIADVSNPKGTYASKVAQITLMDSDSPRSATIAPSAERFPSANYKWYGFSFYLPSNWDPVGKPVRVAQVDSSDLTLPPPFAIRVNGANLEVELNANEKIPGSSVPPTAANTQSRIFTIGRATTDAWHCVVVRALWSSTVLIGDFKLWNSSATELSYQATNTHNTYVGVTPVPRVGLEAINSEGLGVASRTIIVGPIIHGQENTYVGAFWDAMPCKKQ
ncbi:heparin lyase I family protein [Duganella sp. S19_KUP01_CR8]|uniref:heparin lyase I family protein n=1 Tax=Duganella sp. S19_KUP01_CR8 TaxID=3025502 RepID=UPI002FCDCAFF